MKRVFLWSMVLIPFVALAINAEFGALMFMICILALLGWLIRLIVEKRKAAAKARRRKEAPQPAQAEKPIPIPSHIPAPVQEKQERPSLPISWNGLERSYSYSAVNVYMPAPQALEMPGLEIGAAVTLWQDKENQYDKKAVAIVFGGYMIGYLYRGKLQDMANDWMNTGRPILALVDNKAPDGLQISLAFYDKPHLQRMQEQNPNQKAYRLTRCYNAEAQDEISTLSERDELWIEEDEDTGGYNVTRWGSYVGHLPSSAASLVDEWGGEDRCSAFVANIEINDNDKYTISIYLFRGK